MSPADELAPVLYQRYIGSSGGLNFRGEPCPNWSDLPEAIRGHWRAVATTALEVARDLYGVEEGE